MGEWRKIRRNFHGEVFKIGGKEGWEWMNEGYERRAKERTKKKRKRWRL